MSCAEYDSLAEYYDHVDVYRNRADVAFFVERARASGGPVLEVACGTGRVLVPVARAGIQVVGMDLAAGMLEVCRRTLAAESEATRSRVELHEADMRTFDLGREFPLVMLPFRGFQHMLTVEDQLVALARIRRHVAPGGRLILDLFNPSLPFLGDERWLATPLVEPAFTMPDGRSVVRSYRIAARDFFAQTQEVEFVHEVTWPDGRVDRDASRFWIRYVFRFEAEHLLARAGFEVEALFGGYDGQPYGTSYPGELVFVARRPG
jgi:SAM-dependent methyltransferase